MFINKIKRFQANSILASADSDNFPPENSTLIYSLFYMHFYCLLLLPLIQALISNEPGLEKWSVKVRTFAQLCAVHCKNNQTLASNIPFEAIESRSTP